jgi:hypothetical protein
VSLAFFAFRRHPHSWYAAGAELSVVRVASAQASWTVADKLCELVNRAQATHWHPRHPPSPWSKRPNPATGFAVKVAAVLARQTTPAIHHEDDRQG